MSDRVAAMNEGVIGQPGTAEESYGRHRASSRGGGGGGQACGSHPRFFARFAPMRAGRPRTRVFRTEALSPIPIARRRLAALAGAVLLLTAAPAAAQDTEPSFRWASADHNFTEGEEIVRTEGGETVTGVVLPAADGGNPPLTYTLTPAADIPDGVTFDAATRTLTGTPTAAGEVQLILTVTDDDGDSATIYINLFVDGTPSFSDLSADYTWKQGADIGSVVLPAADGGNAPLTYTLTPEEDIPDGVTFDAATRTLTGTPTAAGTANLTLTATDGDPIDPESATLAVNVTVVADEAPSFR